MICIPTDLCWYRSHYSQVTEGTCNLTNPRQENVVQPKVALLWTEATHLTPGRVCSHQIVLQSCVHMRAHLRGRSRYRLESPENMGNVEHLSSGTVGLAFLLTVLVKICESFLPYRPLDLGWHILK